MLLLLWVYSEAKTNHYSEDLAENRSVGVNFFSSADNFIRDMRRYNSTSPLQTRAFASCRCIW